MKRAVVILALVSVPLLMMLQVLQAYRYAVILEETDTLESAQEDSLEHNKRLLAGISVFSAPARIHRVARESLDLQDVPNEKIIQVVFPETAGERP